MTSLIKYEAARAALAEAVTADEVMSVRLEAKALEAVARVAKDFDLELSAAKLRTRAETRLGEMLDQAEQQGLLGKGRPPKAENGSAPEPFSRTTLKEIGIDKKLSSRAKELSGIGRQAVEALLARMERESRERGSVARDVLQTAQRERRMASRVRLQQDLSDKSEELAAGGRRFPVIYADPATRFASGFGDRSIENHYPTMSIEELCALPVASRCLPDTQLFVWSTVPQLANTIALLLPAWGFKYSSHCMWDKTDPDNEAQTGTGLVFMNQHEVLIYATRGNPPGPDYHPKSIYRERKREHSRKPDYYREMITRMTRGLPVLEMFARVDADHPLPAGWFPWGNQAGPIDAAGVPLIHEPTTGEIADDLRSGDPGGPDDRRDSRCDPGCAPDVLGDLRPVQAGVLTDVEDIPAFLRRQPDNTVADVKPCA